MNKETYHIRVEVMNSGGRSIKDKNGNPRPGFWADLSFNTDGTYSEGIEGALRSHMADIGKTMQAWVSEDYIITVEASVKSTIADTYMVLYAYHVDGDRFIKY